MIDIETLLPWLLPPLLGAIIGYLTNSLAIRMLFRPLRRWRFLGLPVPFTPGVIPRRRHELAESIGAMVSRELLTPEVFSRRFLSPRFGYTLRHTIGRIVRELAEWRLDDLARDPRFDRALDMFRRGVASFLCGDATVLESLRRAAARSDNASILSAVLDIPLGVFEPIWKSEILDQAISGTLSRFEQPLLDYFERREVIRETDARIRRLLHFAFDQLNTVQRFVVTAGQFDRQMEERIPQFRRRLVAELRTLLTEPHIAASITQSIRDALTSRREDALRSVLEGIDIGAVLASDAAPVLDGLVRQLVTKERCIDLADRLAGAIRDFVSGDRAIGSVMPAVRRREGAISVILARSIRTVLLGRIDSLVSALNIRQVVVERVDSLEVERVEALLLGIIKRHLRWINLFGALIGALIGGVQVGLRVLGVY